MKRLQLIETGIIAIVLILLYQLVVSLFNIVSSLIISASFPGGGLPVTSFLIGSVFPVVLYLSSIYLLSVYRKPLARKLNGKEPEEAAGKLVVASAHLFHAVLFILCFITLINELPVILELVVRYFTVKQTYDVPEEEVLIRNYVDDSAFWVSCIKVVVVIIILLFSKKIASRWYKKSADE